MSISNDDAVVIQALKIAKHLNAIRKTLAKHHDPAFDKLCVTINHQPENDIGQRMVEVKMTERQEQCLRLLVHGHSNKQIARMIGISEGTAKIHIKRLYQTLGVQNKMQAAAYGAIHFRHEIAMTERLQQILSKPGASERLRLAGEKLTGNGKSTRRRQHNHVRHVRKALEVA